MDKILVKIFASLLIIGLFAGLILVINVGKNDLLGKDESKTLSEDILSEYSAVDLVEVLYSDDSAFTQGLELDDGKLYIGTGLYGQSYLGILDPKTGIIDKKVSLDDKIFGEGISLVGDEIWQLTWKNGKVFVWNKDSFDLVKKFTNEYEGWGLAYDYDKDRLLASDGSNKIFIRDKKDFSLINSFSLSLYGEDVNNINELEYANGYLYANIWHSKKVIKIDLDKEKIVKVYDFTPILDKYLNDDEKERVDEFNGIAHIKDDEFYLTGKLYPKIFRVRLK
ncbi:MAG: glutaminyl-peptide cyclotransferase [Anaerococcus sp.]|nr:glutaminyl-peptide cyclotransferase [Anaerococcus sp.]